MKTSIFFVLFLISQWTFSQVIINGDLVTNTKFKGSPYIGASGGLVKEMNDGLCLGGNIGIRFFTGSLNGGSAFQLPVMGEARYFVNRSTDGFYPFANLGFIFHKYTNKSQLITIDASGTYLSFALGAGVKVGNVDFSVRYENIQFKIGRADNVGFRVGYWLGNNKGKKRRR